MLGLDVDLTLEERGPDRVVVSVLLDPHDGEGQLDGLALQLVRPDGEPLGTRMLLPLAGTVRQPMLSTVELRSVPDTIPQGSRVVGTAWRGAEQLELSLPTDPGTAFEAHVRGHDNVTGGRAQAFLEPLLTDERDIFARHYPWIDEPRIPRPPPDALGVVDHEPETSEVVDDLVDDIGLDEASAEWLRDLLDEPDGSPV